MPKGPQADCREKGEQEMIHLPQVDVPKLPHIACVCVVGYLHHLKSQAPLLPGAGILVVQIHQLSWPLLQLCYGILQALIIRCLYSSMIPSER